MGDFITEQMCEGLKKAQRVKTGNFDALTYACYGGLSGLSLPLRDAGIELITGLILAERVVLHNWNPSVFSLGNGR